MGLTYHFTLRAPAAATSRELESFLRGIEADAKQMGFAPAMVLSADFDTSERKQFSRRLTTGFPVEDERLKGANVPDDSRVWHLDAAGGNCRVPPSAGVVLVVTDERGCEAIFGFMKFPEKIKDTKGAVVAETGLKENWWFHDHLKSPDPRYRKIVGRFREGGFVEAETDEFQ